MTWASTIRGLILAAVLLGGVPGGPAAISSADAAVSLTLAPNYDDTRTTAYPNGDKPVAGCTPPTGYTEADVGDGGGEICEQSATEFDFNVSGSNNATDAHLAYKDAGAGDVQIETRITDTFAGSAEAFASVGIGIREAATQASWLFQCHSLQAGATALQCRYGSNSSYTTANCAADTSRPRYVAVTYDVSSGDIKGFGSADGSTWNECASTNRAMSDVLGYMVGASKSATETTQVTIDNFALGSTIDTYTPSDPPGGSPPVLVTEIENQSAQQGSAFSLDCDANWTGATSYSFSGLPTGITQPSASACEISGTPSSAGTSNVTVTATNVDGDTLDSFSISVSASSGDVFLIPVGGSGTTVPASRTFNCASAGGAGGATWSSIRTSGSGTTPGPGDVIEIDNGTHGALLIQNCSGSDSSRITIRNQTSAAAPAVFQATAASGTVAHFFTCSNCINVNLDGIGKWSGADSGTCGITMPGFVEGKTQCGIQFQTDGAADLPTSWVRFNGTSSKNMIRGVEVDGSGGTGTGGIALTNNDHAFDGQSNSGVWREDITITQNYVHDTGNTTGEGMYIGPNAADDALPLRRIEISYNLLEDIARDGINGKYWRDGPNYVHHNVVRRTGVGDANAAGQQRGINITDGGDVDIYANIVEEAGRDGITCIMNSANGSDPGSNPFYCNVYNNIVIRPGEFTAGHCINFWKGGATNYFSPATADNNTCISPTDNAIGRNFSDPGSTCNARNNIIAPVAAGTVAVNGCTSTNNLSGSIASQNFVNSGADNYELTSTSPACNQASNPASLTTDYEDESRPQDSANDQGADEAAACP